MRWWALSFAALLALCVAGCGGSAPAAPGSTVGENIKHVPRTHGHIRLIDVSIKHDRFVPSLVAVRSGTPIRWTNDDSRPHTVTSTARSAQQFDSGKLAPGASFRITTKHRGRLTYRSTARGDKLRGVVEVG